jgi:phosphonatase-like hydrolase
VLELDLVVFDIAGTTVEDHGQVPAAFSAALAEFGVVVTPEQVRAVRGSSKRQALQSFLPPGDPQAGLGEALYASFRRCLAEQYESSGVKAIPGAERAFRTLRENGVRVALNTGFDRDISRMLLDALGWMSGIVDAVACGDEVAHGRPAPDLILKAMAAAGAADPRRVAVVGDTVLDLQAGASAGVRWNIGVLSGAHDRQALESAPHTHLLPSAAEVPGLWLSG